MEIIGSLYEYRNGSARVEFVWDGPNRDGYAWSHKEQVRLASWSRRRDVVTAYERSDNTDGPYGHAQLKFPDEETG